jgi:uncharacterized 2Fe-2S/4Fe-4S cluster protein (DUF4445 family)
MDDMSIEIITDPSVNKWRSMKESEYSTPSALQSSNKQDLSGKSAIGLGIDLGTTHLRLALWDLNSGDYIAGRSGLNPQAIFGADVLSRLTVAAESDEIAARIGLAVEEAIRDALRDMADKDTTLLGRISRVVIVGNTAMLALLCQHNYRRLLHPDNWMSDIECLPGDTGKWLRSWGLSSNTVIEIVPPLAGFVGSDLLAGVIATGLTEGPAGSLLIDCGTNSEIALWDGRVLWATSAAGGPAFEGCGVGCGMPAEQGAIFKVHLPSPTSDFICEVIGGGVAQGVCGSGLIDATASLFRAGILTRAGCFSRNYGGNSVVLRDGARKIVLTKTDIDILQRAKAATGAATQCLINKTGLRNEEIRRICVAGAFGNYLDVHNAQAIGLLPQTDIGKVELCGNTALAGCRSLLLAGINEITLLKRKSVIVNMSSLPEFEESFIENLYLGPIYCG